MQTFECFVPTHYLALWTWWIKEMFAISSLLCQNLSPGMRIMYTNKVGDKRDGMRNNIAVSNTLWTHCLKTKCGGYFLLSQDLFWRHESSASIKLNFE